jgi:WD40 repeat protein
MSHPKTGLWVLLAGATLAWSVANLSGKAPAPADLEQDKLPPGAVARIGDARLTHGGEVECLAFAPDGKTLASSGMRDGMLRVWNVDTGREKRRLDLSGDKLGRMVQQIAFSPDGKTLAITGQDMVVHFLDAETLKETYALKGQDVRGASPVFAFAPDSKMVVWWSNDGVLRLHDLDAKKEIRNCPLRGIERRFAFSPDGKKLAVMNGLTTSVLDVGTGNEVARHKEERFNPYSLAFSPDGKTLALGVNDVRLLDVSGTKEAAPADGARHDAPVLWLHYTADGKHLYSASHDGQFRTWDVSSGKVTNSFKLVSNPVVANPIGVLAFSPDAKMLAWATRTNRVHLTNLATGEDLHPEGDKPLTTAFAFTADGKQLVTPAIDGKLRLWDAANGKLVRRFDKTAGAPSFLGLADGGKKVVSVEDQTAIVWDVATGKESKRLESVVPRFALPPAISSDGRILAVADGDTGTRIGPRPLCKIHWWDLETGKEVAASAAGHAGRVESLAFAPSGKILASIGVDNTVRIWEVATGKELASVDFGQGHLSKLAYAADGKTLLTAHRFFDGGQTIVRVTERDPETAKERNTRDFKAPMAGAFSPDGTLLAGPAEGNTLRVVDITSGKTIADLKGHQGPVGHVVFSPDGKKLATGSADGTILIWDLARAPKP